MASVGSHNKGAELVLRHLVSFHKMKVCDLSPQANKKKVVLILIQALDKA